jgi:hypothetical protein
MIPANRTQPVPWSEGAPVRYAGAGAAPRVSVCVPLVTVARPLGTARAGYVVTDLAISTASGERRHPIRAIAQTWRPNYGCVPRPGLSGHARSCCAAAATRHAGAGAAVPAAYACIGTSPADHAFMTGSMMRQASSASSPRMNRHRVAAEHVLDQVRIGPEPGGAARASSSRVSAVRSGPLRVVARRTYGSMRPIRSTLGSPPGHWSVR